MTIGTLAAAALSAGASALGKEAVSAAVKEAYATLKAAVAKWAAPNVEQLEAKPDHEARAEVLADIVDETADDDAKAEIRTLAETLQAELHKAGHGATVDNRVTVIADRGSIAAGRAVELGDLTFLEDGPHGPGGGPDE